MEKNSSLVKSMHRKFKISCDDIDGFSEEERQFRIVAMQEELDEYKDACSKEEQLDALVDLIVFALGTAERQGMLEVFDEAFDRVMIANCSKELGPNTKRNSFSLDLKKPEDWKPADLTDLVNRIKGTDGLPLFASNV